jgi:hypothetical protein
MAAYLKKPFTYNPLIARKPLIRVKYLVTWRSSLSVVYLIPGAILFRKPCDAQATPAAMPAFQRAG